MALDAVMIVKFETSNVNANQESSIQTISGTRPQFPEECFILDRNGKFVKHANVRCLPRALNWSLHYGYFLYILMICKETQAIHVPVTYALQDASDSRALFKKNVEMQAIPNSSSSTSIYP